MGCIMGTPVTEEENCPGKCCKCMVSWCGVSSKLKAHGNESSDEHFRYSFSGPTVNLGGRLAHEKFKVEREEFLRTIQKDK